MNVVEPIFQGAKPSCRKFDTQIERLYSRPAGAEWMGLAGSGSGRAIMINTLFPDFLYTGKMPNHEHLKERFMQGLEIAKFPETNWDCNVETTFKQPYTETMDIFPWEEYFAGVSQNIAQMAQEFGSPPLQTKPNGAWVNLYRNGQFQERHGHVDRFTTCSAIYFVNYDHQQDARVSFRNPNADNYVYSNFAAFLPHSLEWYFPAVEEGDVIIFPGFLEHSVSKQSVDRIRLTVSCNYSVLPMEQE